MEDDREEIKFNLELEDSFSNLAYIDKTFNSFTFSSIKGHLLEELTFTKCSISNFNFSDQDFTGDIKKLELHTIYFEDCEFKNTIFTFKDNVNTVEIIKFIYINKLLYSWNISFINFKIKRLEFTQSYSHELNGLDKNYIQSIQLENNIELDHLIISNLHIGTLYLQDIQDNFKTFEIRNCIIDRINIKNSNLWKTIFNGNEIKKLSLKNATINECIFNWNDFKNYTLWKVYIWYSNKIDHKKIKDNYRQLKFVMDKNNNYTEANKFYALEMEHEYKNNLNFNVFNGKIIKNFKSLWSNDFNSMEGKVLWDRIILGIWKSINNFWNNWLATIKFILILWIFSAMIDYSYYNIMYWVNTEILKNYWLQDIIAIILICWWFIYLMVRYFALTFLWTLVMMAIVTDLNFIKQFISFIYPFYWLNSGFIQKLDILQLIWFTFYKIIYSLLFYHLIIALKRTTKR